MSDDGVMTQPPKQQSVRVALSILGSSFLRVLALFSPLCDQKAPPKIPSPSPSTRNPSALLSSSCLSLPGSQECVRPRVHVVFTCTGAPYPWPVFGVLRDTAQFAKSLVFLLCTFPSSRVFHTASRRRHPGDRKPRGLRRE